jgi:hypothetical protein
MYSEWHKSMKTHTRTVATPHTRAPHPQHSQSPHPLTLPLLLTTFRHVLSRSFTVTTDLPRAEEVRSAEVEIVRRTNFISI